MENGVLPNYLSKDEVYGDLLNTIEGYTSALNSFTGK